MPLFDNRLNRRLTDADLPLGLTVEQVGALLQENGYTFHSLGLFEEEGGWRDDPNFMRGGTLRWGVPERGVNIEFKELYDLLVETSDLPNINDPEISLVLDAAAESAANVLRRKFPAGDKGVGPEFEAAIRKALDQMVRGTKPDVRYKPPRMIIDRPLDLEPVVIADALAI
jgi:hypothetical protein